MSVTAVLLNWKRCRNMPSVITALKAQSEPVHIVLVNCIGGNQDTFSVRDVIRFPWNFGPVARLLVGSQANTEFVLFQDDDLMAADTDLVARTLKTVKRTGGLVGGWGRGVQDHAPYYWPEIKHGKAAIIKHRWAMLPTAMLASVRMPPKEARFADDLWLSLELGRGEPAHFVDSELRGGLLELASGAVGLDQRPDHYDSRDEFVRQYLGLKGE